MTNLQIPVYSGPIQQAPTVSFEADWFGLPAPFNPRFRFGLVEETLTFWFAADKPPRCDLSIPRGQFQSGLWEQEVAEFFLSGPGQSYQEFNLSPSGAWWSASFDAYRSPAKECPQLRVRTDCGQDEQGWWAQLSLELGQLEFDWSGALLKPTAILWEDEPRYFCYGHTQGGEPDFHLREDFRPKGVCA